MVFPGGKRRIPLTPLRALPMLPLSFAVSPIIPTGVSPIINSPSPWKSAQFQSLSHYQTRFQRENGDIRQCNGRDLQQTIPVRGQALSTRLEVSCACFASSETGAGYIRWKSDVGGPKPAVKAAFRARVFPGALCRHLGVATRAAVCTSFHSGATAASSDRSLICRAHGGKDLQLLMHHLGSTLSEAPQGCGRQRTVER